jgi:hypothetical protein
MGVDRSAFKKHWMKSQDHGDDIGMNGRPPILDDKINDKWRIQIDPNTMYHILKGSGDAKTVQSTPEEDLRLHVTNEQIDAYFSTLRISAPASGAVHVCSHEETDQANQYDDCR